MARARAHPYHINAWPVFTDAMLAFVLVLVLLLVFIVGRSIKVMDDQNLRQLVEDKRSIRELITDQEGDVAIRDENIATQVITFGEQALFPSGSGVLNEQGRQILSALAQTVVDRGVHTLGRIEVSGHTDDVPTGSAAFSNWELSTSRATGIVRFLQDSGIDPARISLSAAGYGEFAPVCRDATEECRSRNRRIEMKLTYSESLG